MTWDEETKAKLVRAIADGLSASEAGRKLNCSRNAAIGKAHRMGLRFGTAEVRAPPVRRPKAPPALKQAKRMWTPDGIERLRELAATPNITAEIIAQAMSLPIYTVRKKLSALEIRLPPKGLRRKGFTFQPLNRKPEETAPPKPLLLDEGASEVAVTVLTRRRFQCRYIVQAAPRYDMDQALMCGDHAPTDRYCAKHHATSYAGLSFVPPVVVQTIRRAA